jgi:hypothetical protein
MYFGSDRKIYEFEQFCCEVLNYCIKKVKSGEILVDIKVFKHPVIINFKELSSDFIDIGQLIKLRRLYDYHPALFLEKKKVTDSDCSYEIKDLLYQMYNTRYNFVSEYNILIYFPFIISDDNLNIKCLTMIFSSIQAFLDFRNDIIYNPETLEKVKNLVGRKEYINKPVVFNNCYLLHVDIDEICALKNLDVDVNDWVSSFKDLLVEKNILENLNQELSNKITLRDSFRIIRLHNPKLVDIEDEEIIIAIPMEKIKNNEISSVYLINIPYLFTFSMIDHGFKNTCLTKLIKYFTLNKKENSLIITLVSILFPNNNKQLKYLVTKEYNPKGL